MAESFSPALPGDVEWLPGPDGSRVLRLQAAAGDPPALVLRLAGGGERRIETRAAEYVIPRELDWTAAWLQWRDGTQVVLPLPHGRHAEVIELHPRRFAPTEEAPTPDGGVPATPVNGAPPAPSPPETAPDDLSAAPAWTTPPQLPDSSREAEAVWREHGDDLRRELAGVADSIARARDGERSARDAVLTALAAARADLRAARAAREADASTLTAVTGELEVERAAHAVTRGSLGTLADALATARAELAAGRTRARATQAELDAARAELAAGRTGAEAAQAELDAARAELTALKATGAAALADAHRDVTHARAEVASLRQALEAERALRERPVPRSDTTDLERRAREQAEVAAAAARRAPEESAQLLASLDAAAAALRAAPPAGAGATPDDVAATTTTADTVASDSATLEPAGYTTTEFAAVVPASTALVSAAGDRRLRRALIELAREDSVAAGTLLVGLLPAQGAVFPGVLTYDLTVRGVGTFAVFVEGGSARVVPLARRRTRREAPFHLAAEPLVLAQLLAGERSKVRRFGRKAKLSGRRRRLRELAPLPDARLSLADAVKAGARLEPGLVYRALPLAIDPEWTRGHNFTVAQRIVEYAPLTWHVAVRDGQPLRVVERRTEARADAAVTMSRAAFERMLRDEPPAPGDRPQIRGDRAAVAALKGWTDLARGL